MRNGQLTRALCNLIDRAARALSRGPAVAKHIATGRRGEDEAYFHLRRHGYTIVARNWRTPRRRGELDLVAWENGTLSFIEVKTRSSREVVPAEAAVDGEKRREVAAMAREYLRNLPPATPFRFDVVSVYLESGKEPAVEVFKNAYSWRSMKPGSVR